MYVLNPTGYHSVVLPVDSHLSYPQLPFPLCMREFLSESVFLLPGKHPEVAPQEGALGETTVSVFVGLTVFISASLLKDAFTGLEFSAGDYFPFLWKLVHCWWECEVGQPLGNSEQFRNINPNFRMDAVIPLPGMYSRELKAGSPGDMCTPRHFENVTCRLLHLSLLGR